LGYSGRSFLIPQLLEDKRRTHWTNVEKHNDEQLNLMAELATLLGPSAVGEVLARARPLRGFFGRFRILGAPSELQDRLSNGFYHADLFRPRQRLPLLLPLGLSPEQFLDVNH
jgi:hypothetical protein